MASKKTDKIEEEVFSKDRIELVPLKKETLVIPIMGLSPVIIHKFSDKAKRMMLAAQQGNKTKQHDPKDPVTDAEAACYRLEDGKPGMPAVAFKGAIVAGCRFFSGITMTQTKMMIFVEGEGPEQLVPIEGEQILREDTVRLVSGVSDLRYRYMFWPWSVSLTVSYHASVMSRNSLIALVEAGGSAGIGDWRPSAPKSNTGTFGRFAIDTSKQIQVI